MNWVLVPFKGIESGNIRISFGQSRTSVRELLAADFQAPRKNESYPDEDDFITPDDSTFIRIRYDQGDTVRDIEFLAGTLRHQGVDLHDHTTLKSFERYLSSIGGTFRPTKWLGDGWDCVLLGLNVASHEDVGGDGDEIEWVIVSRAFGSSE